MTKELELARKVFSKMSPYEVVDYTCTAVASLQELELYDDTGYNLHSSESIRRTKNFIIDTLIANEIINGFRDKETGEFIGNIQSIQYGRID